MHVRATKPLKPFRRRRWRVGGPLNCHYFYTCARPGRTGREESKYASVPDDLVHLWVLGLPGPETAIVSLLGCKPGGMSEFSFYSFYGGYDVPAEHADSLSFQGWLDRWHRELSILLKEHPTRDYEPIPTETLDAVARDINALLSAGRTVVLVDSGGQERTGQVCKYMGAVEDSSNNP